MGAFGVKRFWFAFVVVTAIWPAVSLADLKKPETVTETLQMMADAYRAMEGVVSVKIDVADNSLSLMLEDEHEVFAYPDNLHQKLITSDTAEERQEIFDFHIQSTLSALQQADRDVTPIDLDRLFPVIRHKSFTEHRETGGDGPKPYIAGELGDSYILYALDSDASVSYLTTEDAEELGLDAAAFDSKGQENLERKYQDLSIEGDSVYVLTLDGFYESSFVTFTPLWEAVDAQIGTVLMAVPARDLVIFLDGDQPGNAETLRALLTEISPDLSYPVSDLLYEWRESAWSVVR